MLKRGINALKTYNRNLSSLFLPGDKAKESYAVLTPHFEFSAKLDDRAGLESNLNSRRKTNLDVESLYEKWYLYREIEQKKDYLEQKRIEIAENLRSLKEPDDDMVRKLKGHGKIVREDLKLLKEHSYALEENFINDFLRLPNEIHSRTPLDGDDDKIIYSYFTQPDEKIATARRRHHLENEQLIEYYDETCYYLKKEAARFDLNLPLKCVDFFREKKFTQFSNSDFVRSVIGEAAGFTNEQLLLVSEDDNAAPHKVNFLHLTGGASLPGFLGCVAKLTIFPTLLPLRWVSRGKQYIAGADKSLGLYGCCQSSVVEAFVAVDGAEKCDAEFDETLLNAIDFYKKFNRHFRCVYRNAEQLNMAESLRACFEMYSPFYRRYIEVGNLSMYGDFISKRLLFNYRDGKEFRFPHIVSGTVINVPKILAILLEDSENCNKSLDLPEFLRDL